MTNVQKVLNGLENRKNLCLTMAKFHANMASEEYEKSRIHRDEWARIILRPVMTEDKVQNAKDVKAYQAAIAAKKQAGPLIAVAAASAYSNHGLYLSFMSEALGIEKVLDVMKKSATI